MREHYAGIQKLLHWLIALAVIGALTMGILITHKELANSVLGEELRKSLSNDFYAWHKATGVLILVLMVLRVFTRLIYGRPGHPVDMPYWQSVVSGIVHATFYALLIAMPIIGWVATASFPAPVPFFGLVDNLNPVLGITDVIGKDRDFSKWLFGIHEIIGKILIGLVLLHILAALYHGLVRRDGVFRRMWFGRGRGAR